MKTIISSDHIGLGFSGLGFGPVQFFYAPDDGVSAGGAPAQSSEAATTSTDATTSASDGKNTGATTEGAETVSDKAQADPNASAKADAVTTETQTQTDNSFRPITSQADLDRVVKERLERQKATLKAEQKQQQLREGGKWEELYNESKAAHEAALAESNARFEELQKQLSKRDTDAAVERAISDHKLDKEAADLFRDAVEGKALDAKGLNERAAKFAKVVAAPVAPATEAGKQANAAAAQTKTDHYSFAPPNAVKW